MGSNNKVNDFVRVITLEEIQPNNIIIFTHAVGGAMGDSGATEIYSVQDGEVCYFYANAYDGFDVTTMIPYLPMGIYVGRFGPWVDDREWMIFGGGMGNEFWVRGDYFQLFTDRLLITPNPGYYRYWHDAVEKFLLDIANGLKSENRDLDFVANKLMQFALKDFIGSEHALEGITAALWCDTFKVRLPFREPIVVDHGAIRSNVGSEWKSNIPHIRIQLGCHVAQILKQTPDSGVIVKTYDILEKNGEIEFAQKRVIQENEGGNS